MSEALVPVDDAQVLADTVAANPSVQRRIAEDLDRGVTEYVIGDDLLRLLDNC